MHELAAKARQLEVLKAVSKFHWKSWTALSIICTCMSCMCLCREYMHSVYYCVWAYAFVHVFVGHKNSLAFFFALGPNKVAFIVSHYTPPHNTSSELHSESKSGDSPPQLLLPALKTRLSLQPALTGYLDQDQVLSWVDLPLHRHAQRLVELAQLEPNPQGLFHTCSVM